MTLSTSFRQEHVEFTEAKNIQAAATVTQLTPVFEEAAREHTATPGSTAGTTGGDPAPADLGATSGTETGVQEDQDPATPGTTAGDPAPANMGATSGTGTGVQEDQDPAIPGTTAGDAAPADMGATSGTGKGVQEDQDPATPGTTASVLSTGRYDDISGIQGDQNTATPGTNAGDLSPADDLADPQGRYDDISQHF